MADWAHLLRGTVLGHPQDKDDEDMVPAYRLEGPRLAHRLAEESLCRERASHAQTREEVLRSRSRIAELDPDAPRSEYDGTAWWRYWSS